MSTLYGLKPALDTRASTAFCGPTAIAAITGRTVVDVEDALLAYRAEHPPAYTPRASRGRPAPRVRTMWGDEARDVLARLGWRVVSDRHYWPPRDRPTFQKWCNYHNGTGPFLILITGHFVAVSGHWFVDTEHREPIPLKTAPYRRSRVLRVWRVEPQE